jgi:hypothetical protein
MKLHSFFISMAAMMLGAAAASSRPDNRVLVLDPGDIGPAMKESAKEDLGDLEAEEPAGRGVFAANLQTRVAFVSNALQQGFHASGDLLYLPALQAGFSQPLPRDFSLDLIGRAESVIYSRYSRRNYWGTGLSAYLNWRNQPQGLLVYAGAEPYEYQDFSGGNITAGAGVTAGIEKTFPLDAAGRMRLLLSYKFADYFSRPNTDDRMLHRATVMLSRDLTASTTAQLYYAFQYGYYPNRISQPFFPPAPPVREDSRNLLGVNLSHRFNGNLTGMISAAWFNNDSTVNAFDNQNLLVSIGVDWRFF